MNVERLEILLEKVKETKNTVRYEETGDGPPVIGNIYIQKWAVNKAGLGDRIVVEVKPA